MDYAKPLFTVQEVNAAGNKIADLLTMPNEQFEKLGPDWIGNAFTVINNWRAAHNYPLNSIYVTLKNRSSKIHTGALIAQRIKRVMSIGFKLANQRDMKLSQMQDIGGCRAILPTLANIHALRDAYRARPLTHAFIGEKDYIDNPKNTGYRGIHLKYRFSGKATSAPWDGLKIEIQLRTTLQHTWATAVEAAGTFTSEALKSNKGRQEWLRFFALMSSVFALREGCNPIPGTPPNIVDLHNEIMQLNKQHHMVSVFAQYRKIIPRIDKQSYAKYFLVTLDPVKREVNVKRFGGHESQRANAAYTQMEAAFRKTDINVVLVSVSSIKALKRAYPNYFLDTEDFLREVSLIVGDEYAA